MIIVLKDKNYTLNDEVWRHYLLMHPVKSLQSLASDVKITFGDQPFSSKEIEEMIEDEYNVQMHINESVSKARDQFNGN